MRSCGNCGVGIITTRADAKYCSTRCRVAAHRRGLPVELTSRDRWIRYSSRKVPLTVDGKAASSTDSSTWTNYQEARAAAAGVGIGFVLGDNIGCKDLDHCMVDGKPNKAAREFIARYPHNYIEVSPSGDGLHIWGTRPEAVGTKQTIDGLSVETYSIGRYITVTGNVYQHGTLAAL